MFYTLRPSIRDIERFLEVSRELPLSYEPVGLAQEAHRAFDADEPIVALGPGAVIHERAKAALRD